MAGTKVGRPEKKFEDVFSDGWQETLIGYYLLGYSDVQIRFLMRIPLRQWTKFAEENEGFRETLKDGKDFSEGWWQTEGMKNLANKDFNNTLWLMNMVNRFGWTRDTKHEKPLDTEALIAALLEGRVTALQNSGGQIA